MVTLNSECATLLERINKGIAAVGTKDWRVGYLIAERYLRYDPTEKTMTVTKKGKAVIAARERLRNDGPNCHKYAMAWLKRVA